ncbi:winged helix-turn-helix domain-containing protein [Actinomadura alba]|uniref:Response regulator transcription factor n=1 Tax=Actinomadura alba TaxID=406431 RepID=A0ABR7LWH6_9ACTN|nr:response regulator transcription factor [Actinomadura alba]MBC6469208.1 response regulator transcription factor [Actinomadura alba]
MVDEDGRVLVVEHDPGVAELERLYLTREGFVVDVEPEPADAPAAAARIRPDIVVLDVSAPGVRPAELYRRVAEAAHPAPIICVHSPDTDQGELGEYRVSRPFGPRLLVAAVADALRRRDAGDGADVLRMGAVTLDPQTRSVSVPGGPAALTATEFDLLAFFMANPGRVFTREQLLDAAWAPGASAGTRTVDVHIAQLRAKLGAASPIRTVRGVGYAADL